MTNITQEDRDAAADYWSISRIGNSETQRRYRAGEADASMIVQAFARHREAAEAKERERIVAWLKERERESLNGHVIAGCRMGIERGDHMEANNATGE